jgi:hypothetical protein
MDHTALTERQTEQIGKRPLKLRISRDGQRAASRLWRSTTGVIGGSSTA